MSYGLCMSRVLRGHRGSVLTLYAFGNLLLSGGRDNIIRVWVRACNHMKTSCI